MIKELERIALELDAEVEKLEDEENPAAKRINDLNARLQEIMEDMKG